MNSSWQNETTFVIFSIVLAVGLIALFVVRRLLHVSSPLFFFGLLGLLSGLLIGALVSLPFARLPGLFGQYVPIVVNVFVAVAMLDLFLAQAQPLIRYAERFLAPRLREGVPGHQPPTLLVDSSIIVDGRIEALAEAGFLTQKLVIPQFVLHELQTLADSADSLKRARGRRALDVLKSLRIILPDQIEILPDKPGDLSKVDARLVKLAHKRGYILMTIDTNLARVAEIQGVKTLSVQVLAEALRPLLIPGEALSVRVMAKGKEPGQGIGYLPDGTLVVVENGDKLIGQDVAGEVSRIFQTVAGKMIFVKPSKESEKISSN